jgi:hypothetical protein
MYFCVFLHLNVIKTSCGESKSTMPIVRKPEWSRHVAAIIDQGGETNLDVIAEGKSGQGGNVSLKAISDKMNHALLDHTTAGDSLMRCRESSPPGESRQDLGGKFMPRIKGDREWEGEN